MSKKFSDHKTGIDFFLSFLVIAVATWLLISDCCSWNENMPNYLLIILAVICVLFRLWVNRSNSVFTIHTAIHALSLAVIIGLICMNKAFSISIGNIATFSTAALAFISSEFLLSSNKSLTEEISAEDVSAKTTTTVVVPLPTPRTKALTYLSESMNSVPAPNTLTGTIKKDSDAVDKMRDAYIKIINDVCFSLSTRESFKNTAEKYYDQLDNIHVLSDSEYRNLYSKLYHCVKSFIDNA